MSPTIATKAVRTPRIPREDTSAPLASAGAVLSREYHPTLRERVTMFFGSPPAPLTYCRVHQRAWVASLERWVAFHVPTRDGSPGMDAPCDRCLGRPHSAEVVGDTGVERATCGARPRQGAVERCSLCDARSRVSRKRASAAQASTQPLAIACPLIAATTGFGKQNSVAKRRRNAGRKVAR